MPTAVEQLLLELNSFRGDYLALAEREEQAAGQVKRLSPEEQVELVLSVARVLASRQEFVPYALLAKAMSAALRHKPPFTPEQILRLVECGADPSYYFPFTTILRLAESAPMTPELEAALRAMQRASVLRNAQVQGSGGILRRIGELLEGKEAAAAFQPAGSWSRRIAAEVTPAWRAVLESGREIPGGEPSRKWRAAAAARAAEIGPEAFRRGALRWLALGPSPDAAVQALDARESDYQRGLLWSLAGFADAETCAAIARFAEQCLRKIPMVGAVSQKSGNACVNVLAAMPGKEPVSQLARLAVRVKYQTAQRLVQEALEQAAAREGVSREELEEITVPAFGLDAQGRRAEQLGEFSAELTAEGSLSWKDAAGKPLRAAPEAVKRDHASEYQELKQAAKEIGRMGAAHRARLERLLLSQRQIPVETWRPAYVDHPLLGGLARRLIWQFASGDTAIWRDGRMAAWNGEEVAAAGWARLWHPLASDVQTILSWRCWLEDQRVQQPFKQAHREVYIVTDAERACGAYSNRFAGHILKQHQFAALCEQRGWRFRLMGPWDSHNTPYLDLPQHGMRVEYAVEFPRDEAVSGHAVYLYLATDQVRFVDAGTGAVRSLESVPPMVFSEAMRDVDLFVGVASIGNDPAWGQRADAPFGRYWNEFSFGDLSAAAAQRRELLERLLPKLAIQDRCRLDDRFLQVRGDRATYKIHLGSGNVLIEPGSRYLCIVRGPASGAPSRVFLPFEGDDTLGLILSKAFLLAADARITDPAIVRQLP